MFWDGTRWIDERERAATLAPSRHWVHSWLATGFMIVAIAALSISFGPASTASSKATNITADSVDVRGLTRTDGSALAPAPPIVPTMAPGDAGHPAPSAHAGAPAALPHPTPDQIGNQTATIAPLANPTLTPSPAATPGPTTAQAGVSRALGVYVHNSAWDLPLVDAYAAQAGRMPNFATTYQMWGTSGDGWQFDATMLNAFAARGINLVLSWQPFDWHAGGQQPDFALSTILSGAHDDTIRGWVEGARAYGKPVYIRFAHEMNGDWYPWGQRLNGNTPAQYVAAWRYVVDMFRDGGATNVRWVWSPNVVGLAAQYPLAGLYPGDSYVDLIGLDGYNWGTSGVGEMGWRSFTEIFGATYDQVRAEAPSKPVYIAEMASTELGGDKAACITSAFLSEIPKRFPALTGVVWFDPLGAMEAVTPSKNSSWGIDSSSSALNAFRFVVASSLWRGTLH